MFRFPVIHAICARPILLLVLPASFMFAAGPAKRQPPGISVVRWTEGAPGSTFSRTPDGKYVYDLKNGSIEIAITIDSQELEKVRHRPLPVFAVRLNAQYSGQQSFELSPDPITLEFVSHYQVISEVLDPDELARRIQNDIDSVGDETEHEVRKHPEKKQEQESLLQSHLKDMTELVGFVSLYGLRGTTLNHDNSAAGGWIFFSANSKWIGKWKSQEQFLLRMPVEDRIFEFPFALPPHKGDLSLRRRPD
jgi:hypothetical protein